MGTPAGEEQLEEGKEEIHVITTSLLCLKSGWVSGERQSNLPALNWNHLGSETLECIFTSGGSAGGRLIMLGNFTLLICSISCLQLYHPQTDLDKCTQKSRYHNSRAKAAPEENYSLSLIVLVNISRGRILHQNHSGVWVVFCNRNGHLGEGLNWSSAAHCAVKPLAPGDEEACISEPLHRASQVRNKNSLLGNEFSPNSTALSLGRRQTKLLLRIKASSDFFSLWFLLLKSPKTSSIVSRPESFW